jgi:hypothetical protein
MRRCVGGKCLARPLAVSAQPRRHEARSATGVANATADLRGVWLGWMVPQAGDKGGSLELMGGGTQRRPDAFAQLSSL